VSEGDRPYLILCDFAEVINGKLYVMGAGVDQVVMIGAPANLALGIMLSIPWAETNTPQQVKVQLVTEDGEVLPGADGEPFSIEGPCRGRSSAGDEARPSIQRSVGRAPASDVATGRWLPLRTQLERPSCRNCFFPGRQWRDIVTMSQITSITRNPTQVRFIPTGSSAKAGRVSLAPINFGAPGKRPTAKSNKRRSS
jgi:hypothetical protein